MKRIPPDPDEVNDRVAVESEIDELIASLVGAARERGEPVRIKGHLSFCTHCGADLMGGTTCPEKCTAGDEESPN